MPYLINIHNFIDKPEAEGDLKGGVHDLALGDVDQVGASKWVGVDDISDDRLVVLFGEIRVYG